MDNAEHEKRLQALEDQFKDQAQSLDLETVAQLLNVSRRYVDTLIDERKLQAYSLDITKQRQTKRVTKADLIAYILKNQIN